MPALLGAGLAVNLSPGEVVGPYRIESLIAGGGMGEVYRASDTRLNRDVALKVLPRDAARDPGRLRRFEQEARAASSLNHPNIVVVYEIGEALVAGRDEPLRYIAMELVDGEDLQSLLHGGPLSLKRCLDLAAPLADGLACAHESGIVHRDIKPSNIMVTRDGHPKILDFGLAKLSLTLGPDESAPSGDTLTSPGAVLGTVGYMSPEQASGAPITAASDQFSFGCILYEMLTRRRAFARASVPETLAAIIREDPAPIEEIRPGIPAPLRWLVERCLAKPPRERYASTRDLAHDLQRLRERSSDPELRSGPGIVVEPAHRRPAVLAAGGALLALVSATATFFLSGMLRAPPEPEFRPLTFRRGTVSRAIFAPGSGTVLYTAAWEGQPARTYQTLAESSGLDRSLDAETQYPLAYSEDGSQVLVLLGVFSPAIVMRGTLAWWPALGGKPREVLEDAGWAEWAGKARTLAVVRDLGGERRLEIRDAEGGLLRTAFKTPGGISHVRISPDEKSVAFILHATLVEESGEVWTVSLDGSGARRLTPRFERCWGLDWNRATGEIWFTGKRTKAWDTGLWAVTLTSGLRLLYTVPGYFVLQSVSAAGDRCLLLSVDDTTTLTVRRAGRAAEDLSWFSWTVVTDLSADEKSVLFFDGGASQDSFGTWIRPLAGGDAVHLAEGVPSRFSTDGRSIVTVVEPPGQTPQLALVPVGAGTRRQLTHSSATHLSPAFAGPDTLLFVRSEAGASEVWRMQTDGSGSMPLGASGCDLPAADPAAGRFLCVGEPPGRALFVFPMEKGPGRKLYELPPGRRFKYARWDGSGRRIFSVTGDRRFIALDAASGTLLSEETLPVPGAGTYDKLIGAAFSADATLQAYSVAHVSSILYQATGLK